MITINRRRYWLFPALILAQLIGCREDDILGDFKRGDYHIVVAGSYDGTADYIGSGSACEKTVADYRRLIEAHIAVLSDITRHDFPGPAPLRFEFKMALWDRIRNYLVLRYYAPLAHDTIYAGYQLFFVCEVERKGLVRIYSSEVPLE